MLKIKKQRISFIVLVIILAVLLLGTIVIVVRNERVFEIPTKKTDQSAPENKVGCEKRLVIDGQCLAVEDPGVYAVMIDNHIGARPPAGLSQARLVYETIVEHPITRFLAVFSLLDDVEKIGPIRSARPFYVDWAKEFNCPYAHVGGSDEAIQNLEATYNFDLNEFYNGSTFYRDNYRSAPHNVFTSSKLIKEAISEKKWTPTVDFTSWKYNLESPVDGDVRGLQVDFKTSDFLVRWEYDITNKNYVRYQRTKVHADTEGNEIKASNVVIMYTDSSIIDNYGRLKTRTIGSGKALVFRNGVVIEGLWQRNNLAERTMFYNKDGSEIMFNVGTTWIEVVTPDWVKITY